ncbi:MAG: class I SAM-dependent methyltransferase [Alphaproteobacteria bacterium]
MGINCGNLILLKGYADALAMPNPLGDLLMFGRLTNTLSDGERARVAKRHKVPQQVLAGKNTEPLLKELGASNVLSLDISDYEGCDIVFDLMDDVAQRPDLKRIVGRFDTILDFGTSEHVFNAPQALVNAWNMLKDGGRYIFDLPVTGWVSHGLYQFSPNYFYSVGKSGYFRLAHLFFHHKRGDKILAHPQFRQWRLRQRQRCEEDFRLGCPRKDAPGGHDGASRPRGSARHAIGYSPGGAGGRRQGNRTFGMSSIQQGFAS